MALDILEFGVKLSVLLGIGGALTVSMRRRSAAARHLVWTLTVIGTLALPFASLAGPRWTLPIRRAVMPALGVQGLASTESASTVPTATDTGTRDALAEPPAQGQTTWAAAAIAIYVAGLLLLLTRLLLDYSHIHRVVARASVIDDGAWVDLMKTCANRLNIARQPRLLFGHDDVVPVAAGAMAADIVLPSTAQAWDANRRRSVLLHELAHVARRDCLTQLLAEIAVALYWPHPGVWWAARRLRVERELACDDRVLSCDMPADVYAEQLLELAYAHSRHRTPALAVTMARPGQLEGRMRALMEHRRNRATPSAGWRLAATAAAGVAVLTLAATTVAVVPIAPVAAAESASQGPAQSTGLAASLPPGTWQLRRLPDGRSIQITVSEREGSYHGGVLRIDRFDGLAAALAGDGRGLVQFRLKRDAGTFAFEGTLRDGIGGGTVTFLPDATFPDALAKRGFDRPMLIQQVILAAADIGFDFVDALAAERYSRPTLDQLVNAGQHGVNGTDIKELAALGYRLETVDGLVRFHDHGVSPNYVRDLRGQGLDRLSADDLVRAHDHGIDANYVRGLRTRGYQLALADFITAHDHGISPSYIDSLRSLGYTRLSFDDLLRAHDHGVSEQYINDLATFGYANLTLDDVIRLHDHGIGAQWLRTASAGRGLSVNEIIRLHDQGPRQPDRTPSRLRQSDLRTTLRTWLAWAW